METRRRLMAAGQVVFAEKGIDAATIQDIAEAADVGRGSFYNFFETKEGLVAALVADLDELIVSRAVEGLAPSASPTETVASLLLHALDDLTAQPPAAWFVVRTRPADGVRFRRSNELIVELLEAGRACGEFSIAGVEVGTTIVAGIMRSGIEALLTGQAHSSQPIVELTLRSFGVPAARAAEVMLGVATPLGGSVRISGRGSEAPASR